MSELAATLAHEINQPLGAIVSNAEAASRLVDLADPRRAEQLETLGDIIDDGQRASEVIRRLRAMLRTGATEQNPMIWMASCGKRVVRRECSAIAVDVAAPQVPRRASA